MKVYMKALFFMLLAAVILSVVIAFTYGLFINGHWEWR